MFAHGVGTWLGDTSKMFRGGKGMHLMNLVHLKVFARKMLAMLKCGVFGKILHMVLFEFGLG